MAKKNVLYCRGCNAPLAEKDGEVIRVVKFHNHKELPIEIHVRHSGSGVIEINCERCKGTITGHNFVTLQLPKGVEVPVDKKLLTKKGASI